MKPSKLKELIKRRIAASVRRSLLIEGSPGLGKTEIVKQVAKELGIGCIVLHCPLMQPEDYGFPVISADRANVDFIVSKQKFPLEGSDCPESGILLFDEVSQCDASTQKIIANALQAKEIHGKYFKKGWTIIATGNRAKDRAGANRILSHLGNRVTRIQFDASLDDWTQWALANAVKPEVIAFIRFRPELLSNFDPQVEVNATPRSWVEGVSDMLGVADAEEEFETFKGDVGEGPASEFLGFLKIYRKLPSPDAIIVAPDKTAVPSDPATLYALCGALAHRTSVDNFGRIMTYVKRMPQEFVVLYVRDALAKCAEIANTKDYVNYVSGDGAKLLT